MNLLDKGKVLVALCLLSMLYSSCEEELSTIGLPNRDLDINYLEYDIPVKMVWVDSVESQNIGTIYTGAEELEDFGVVEATPFISYTSPQYIDNNSVTIPHNAIFKDVYLNVDYSSVLTDGKNFEIDLEVYQLADTIASTAAKTYFIEDKIALGDLVGSKTVIFDADTLEAELTSDTVEYSETIQIDHTLGQFLLNKLKQQDPEVYSNYTTFKSSFPGLSVIARTNNNAIIGFAPPTSNLIVEYTYIDEDGEERDGILRYQPLKYFHNITPNRLEADLNGAPFSDLTCCYNEYEPSNEYVYQLFGTGINLLMDLSELANLDTLNNPKINSASLVLDSVQPAVSFSNPPSISYYLVDENANRITEQLGAIDFYVTLPENTLQADPLRLGQPIGIPYNATKKQYLVDITLYLQTLIEDPSTPDRLLLENANRIALGGNLVFLKRASILRSGIRVPKSSVKVKIYYSTVE